MYSYIRVLIACSASVCGMLWNTSCDKFGSEGRAHDVGKVQGNIQMYSYIRVIIACNASVCGMLWNTSCDKIGSNHPAYIQTNVCQQIQLQLIDAETARALC